MGFDDPETAYELVVRWRKAHAEALVVVDQFEELFTLNGAEAQGRFASLLGRLSRDGDVHVLLSMRDDFLIRCSEQEALSGVFLELTPLPALSREGLVRALVEPAKRRGFRFEDEGLVEEMVASVEGARGALPLLAFAVSRLWERRDRDRKLLTRAAYEEIGGVAGALAQHAEATMDRIGTERQAMVREVFRNLVTAQGTRAVAEREELLSVFPERKSAEEVLEELIDARLLTSFEVEGREGEPSRHRIEIAHESLLKAWPRLVRWQAQDEEGAVLRDQLKQAAHLWEEKGRTSDILWTGTAFQEYELWRGRYRGGTHCPRGGLRAGDGSEGEVAEAAAHGWNGLGNRRPGRIRDRDRRFPAEGGAGGAAGRGEQAADPGPAEAAGGPDRGPGLYEREPGAGRHDGSAAHGAARAAGGTAGVGACPTGRQPRETLVLFRRATSRCAGVHERGQRLARRRRPPASSARP